MSQVLVFSDPIAYKYLKKGANNALEICPGHERGPVSCMCWFDVPVLSDSISTVSKRMHWMDNAQALRRKDAPKGEREQVCMFI